MSKVVPKTPVLAAGSTYGKFCLTLCKRWWGLIPEKQGRPQEETKFWVDFTSRANRISWYDDTFLLISNVEWKRNESGEIEFWLVQLRGRAREIGDYSTSRQKVRSVGGYLTCFRDSGTFRWRDPAGRGRRSLRIPCPLALFMSFFDLHPHWAEAPPPPHVPTNTSFGPSAQVQDIMNWTLWKWVKLNLFLNCLCQVFGHSNEK